jgi:hypothetical protein
LSHRYFLNRNISFVLELRQGTFEFLDNYNSKRTGNQRLFPAAAFVGGKAAPQRA